MKNQMKAALVAASLSIAAPAGAGIIVADPASSTVTFQIKHLLLMTAEGKFSQFSGQIEQDEQNFLLSKVTFKVQVSSVDTGNEKRDEHLRTADFFNVAEFPEAAFTSSKIEAVADGSYRMSGALTIHGKTKTVVFNLVEEKSEDGRRLFRALTELNRLDFEIGQSSLMVGDLVKLQITLAVTTPITGTGGAKGN